MNKALIAGIWMAFLLGQTGIAQGQILDLPDPGSPSLGEGSLPGPSVPAPAPADAPDIQNAGSVSISGITRKTGGELYIVWFKNYPGQSIKRLDLRVMSHRLKIHRATFVSNYGSRIDLPTLSNLDVLDVDSVTTSGALAVSSEPITQLELVLESYGGNSQLVVTALGQNSSPQMMASLVQEDQPDLGELDGGQAGNNQYESILDPNFGLGSYTDDGQCASNGFCVNDRIQIRGGGRGIITGFSTNGMIYVQMDSDFDSRQVHVSTLVREDDFGFKIGTRVSYNGLRIGTVTALLGGGVVHVQDAFDRVTYQTTLAQLAMPLECFNTLVCRGVRASLRKNRKFIIDILEVYSNGSVLVRAAYKNDLYIVKAGDIRG